MPVETRFFRSDQQTINGLTAFVLGISQSSVSDDFYCDDFLPFYWGIRVWKRASSGVETEITTGVPVAQVSRTDYGSGIQSNTWNCPQVALNSTDAIVIRVYVKSLDIDWRNNGDDGLIAVWVSEQLGASKLDAAVWTVYYYTSVAQAMGGVDRGHFRFGVAAFNSRIENFVWSSGVPAVVAQPLGDGLSWIQRGS